MQNRDRFPARNDAAPISCKTAMRLRLSQKQEEKARKNETTLRQGQGVGAEAIRGIQRAQPSKRK
jgi:hypothetical protein